VKEKIFMENNTDMILLKKAKRYRLINIIDSGMLLLMAPYIFIILFFGVAVAYDRISILDKIISLLIMISYFFIVFCNIFVYSLYRTIGISIEANEINKAEKSIVKMRNILILESVLLLILTLFLTS
jgi:hypothetical protein